MEVLDSPRQLHHKLNFESIMIALDFLKVTLGKMVPPRQPYAGRVHLCMVVQSAEDEQSQSGKRQPDYPLC